VLEAERQRLDLHLGELVRVHVSLDRQVRLGRSQILADRQDVAVDGAKVAERQRELLARLAKAHHQARFRVDSVFAAGGFP
jgi:hypothetical protein